MKKVFVGKHNPDFLDVVSAVKTATNHCPLFAGYFES
jgi:hypothetical protein